MVMRIATSEQFAVSPLEIEREWSYYDVWAANVVLDEIARATKIMAKRAEKG